MRPVTEASSRLQIRAAALRQARRASGRLATTGDEADLSKQALDVFAGRVGAVVDDGDELVAVDAGEVAELHVDGAGDVPGLLAADGLDDSLALGYVERRLVAMTGGALELALAFDRELSGVQ
jgi:hypothetical protein